MDAPTRQLIQQIHDCTSQIVLVTAGAGTQALSDLLGVAGATRTLLEALVPYSAAAFDDFLGQTPKQYVHPKTAKLMAGRAYTRARLLDDENHPLIGLACTATIVTDRPKRGEHRAHIASWQPQRLVRYGIHLEKGTRDRSGEENVVSTIMLNGLARACGIEQQIDLALRHADQLEIETNDFAAVAQQLARQQIPFFGVHAHGRIVTRHVSPQALLSGAFNPLHDGHLELAQTAADQLGQPVAFELAATNVDKPPLPPDTILSRLAQFAGRWPVYVSNAPTYLEKSALYPDATFVIGYDTAVRVLHPRYYGNSHAQMLDALKTIRDRGCCFLVAGRSDDNGRFHDIHDLAIPADLTTLFHGIPPEKFRKDISSTELRARGEKGSR